MDKPKDVMFYIRVIAGEFWIYEKGKRSPISKKATLAAAQQLIEMLEAE